MERRSFLKGMVAAGTASLLPAGELLQGCTARGNSPSQGWDFDEVIDRSGTWSIKWGRAGEGQIPMWIADMDFRTDPAVRDALAERLRRDVMGYTSTPEEFVTAIRDWVETTHGYPVPREWVNYAPGVITSINQAYLRFSEPGDRIIVQPPVYDPFKNFALRLGREVVDNPLVFEDGKYRMDFEGLERLIDKRTKAIVLCNPHNPCGILWDKETLATLAEICDRHGILVFSDEIHADLALYGRRHTPFCSVSETAAKVGIIFSGPTKAFNLAGLSGTAYCIIPDGDLRNRYVGGLHDAKLSEASIMSLVATIAAYTSRTGWLEALKRYLEGNIGLLMDFFKEEIPGITPIRPEASFLVWLDCRALGLAQDKVLDLFNKDAGVLVNNGASYGTGGEGFVRLNIGCPRSVLQEALERIRKAIVH